MISIALQTDKPLHAYGPLAQRVEQLGFDVISVYNDLFFQPAWPPLFEIARHTQQIRLGPAAVNPYLSHPISIAGQLALLDEISQGRAYLGIARGAWLDRLNIQPQRPARGLSEALACIRHLLAQNKAPLAGEIFSLAGGETLRWPIRRSDIPFMLGAWGPKTIRSCLHQVAEVKVGGTANPAVVTYLKNLIRDADRTAQVGLVVGAVTVADPDGFAARAEARRQVALYLPVVARLDPTLELDPTWLSRLQAAVAAGNQEQAAGLISDEMLSKFAFAGTPTEIVDQAAALLAAGADRIEFGTPHGLTAIAGLELLGQHVLPALKAQVK